MNALPFVLFLLLICGTLGFVRPSHTKQSQRVVVGSPFVTTTTSGISSTTLLLDTSTETQERPLKRKVVIIGAGWGGLSAAHALSKETDIEIVVIEGSARVGGLVRDGFTTMSGTRQAEAGQHGFWNNYHNIFRLLKDEIPGLDHKSILTDYAEQGQYSPRGLEAVWPVYKDQTPQLPTGLAQAVYTKFLNLSLLDRLTAAPLVLAFSEFDDSPEAWERYDQISFRDLCVKLGVSKKCYEEAFEPMILTGLFAPGSQCSAAAALGMAYFFVLQSQVAFDVQWCRGNIGEVIFDPWVKCMEDAGVKFETSTFVTGFNMQDHKITSVQCKLKKNGRVIDFECDEVVFAVGAKALNAIVSTSPNLAKYSEFRRFANLRGTSVLATRIFLNANVTVPFSANACWGFDKGVGMTLFDIKALHGPDAKSVEGAVGSVLEVDYYHASNLLAMSDDDIVAKVKKDLDKILGPSCKFATVVDAAVVRLPNAVNWYYPGSYHDMPDSKSTSLSNLYFAGDIVRTRHGSWSQEKAYVTGIEASNYIMGRDVGRGIVPLSADEPHVTLGKTGAAMIRNLVGAAVGSKNGPSLVDFLW